MIRRALVVAGAVLALSGCGIRGLNFVEDERVQIISPPHRSEVMLPVTVRWSVEDFEITGPSGDEGGDAGYFGVFVDRAPPAPGQSLTSLVADDPVCKATPGCPDEAYLAGQRAYTTSNTHFTIERVPELTDDRTREVHEVTIVLLDGKGHRIGESAFRVEFYVRRAIRR